MVCRKFVEDLDAGEIPGTRRLQEIPWTPYLSRFSARLRSGSLRPKHVTEAILQHASEMSLPECKKSHRPPGNKAEAIVVLPAQAACGKATANVANT